MAPDLPEIRANARQLTDLWVNLLLLARSAAEDGEKGSIMELSLCREIVLQNHGKISISGSGVETIFRVTFSVEGNL